VAYTLLARREERRVIEEFGNQYLEYQRRVPMFFPRMGQWKQLIAQSNVAEDER